MKKSYSAVILFCCLLLFQQKTGAQTIENVAANRNMLGIRISSSDAVVNNSITYKRFLNPTLAVEGLFSFSDPAALGLMLEKHTYFGSAGLSWYWGAGAYAGFGGTRRFGAMGAAGIDLILSTLPLNLSADWKPELNFTRVFSFEPAAFGVSVRYTF